MAAQIPGALFTEVMKWIKKETEETDEHGDPVHADMASWLSAKVAIGDYPNQLDALEKQVLACLVKNSKMVKAINDKNPTPLLKLVATAYKRTMKKFWLPILESRIRQNFTKL